MAVDRPFVLFGSVAVRVTLGSGEYPVKVLAAESGFPVTPFEGGAVAAGCFEVVSSGFTVSAAVVFSLRFSPVTGALPCVISPVFGGLFFCVVQAQKTDISIRHTATAAKIFLFISYSQSFLSKLLHSYYVSKNLKGAKIF